MEVDASIRLIILVDVENNIQNNNQLDLGVTAALDRCLPTPLPLRSNFQVMELTLSLQIGNLGFGKQRPPRTAQCGFKQNVGCLPVSSILLPRVVGDFVEELHQWSLFGWLFTIPFVVQSIQSFSSTRLAA